MGLEDQKADQITDSREMAPISIRYLGLERSSHQIMHCLVVCAGIAHLFGLVRAFDHIHGHGSICAK